MRTFMHQDFGNLRTVRQDEDIYFAMGDVARALNIEDVATAFAQLPEECKAVVVVPDSAKKLGCVNQYGIKHLVTETRTKEAIDYQTWVLTDVIPKLNEPEEPENGIQVFSNPEFGNVWVVMKDGDPWFIGKDVTKVLGYQNGSRDINRHVDDEDKGYTETVSPDGIQKTTIINESGLYSLILSSKLPTAKAFKRWVISDVLPSIRKHGMYATPKTLEDMIGNPEFGIRLLTELKNEQDRRREAEKKNAVLTQENTTLTQENAIMKPKASYYDIVLQCSSLLTITQIAKDYGFSDSKLNNLLHDFGVQYKSGKVWLLYQKYADCGYVQSATAVYTEWDGMLNASTYTKWTQKGRLFMYNLLKEHDILPLIEQENDNE